MSCKPVLYEEAISFEVAFFFSVCLFRVDNGPPMKKSERPLFRISRAATPAFSCGVRRDPQRPGDRWSADPRAKIDASHWKIWKKMVDPGGLETGT